MNVIRDLTPEELEHAAFLARRWDRLCKGRSEFGRDCEELALNGWLTRSQFEKLKEGPVLREYKSPRRSLNTGRSKRPITLASKA